jgi:hypothetical protein
MRRSLALLAFSLLLLAPAAAQQPDLLHPKAIPAQKPATVEQLRNTFAAPPNEYRSMPLWVWNDEMEWPRLQQMLAEYKRQGMGGAFVHPRPGLMTEYMGQKWFSLWRQSMQEGKRLGLFVNIYDENSYPSGFAGGNVPARAPDTASQYVVVEENLPASAASANPLTVAYMAVRKDEKGVVVSARRVTSPTDVEVGETVSAFRLHRASGNPWTAGFPYVDLTNPRTTPEFLKTTYEVYKQEIGSEFGKTVRWSFTDEPLLATGGAYDSAKMALPLSFATLAAFRSRNGYDLADEIASLYWDTGDYRKVRFDYWQTLHDLWKENFMQPMFAWCDKNQLQFTGHWMEHEWPYPWITPDDASLYAFEHVPGIDMLEGTKIRTTGSDPHMLFTIRQMASVSHQLGRRAFCEAYGVSGWDSTFEHYKRFGDWLMVNGVNFMDQHLSFVTIRGARKRDHPQSFSDVAAWWPYYRTHADHLARVSYLSSVSAAKNRVLVLQQTTSGFLLARRGAPTPELEGMRARNAELNQFLADRQVDYDLGDEYMLEWFGRVEGKKLTVGLASYDVLVLPRDLANLRKQTVPLLTAWLAAGGTVLSLSDPPAYVDGRSSDAATNLRDQHGPQWIKISSDDELLAALNRIAPPRVRFAQQANLGLGLQERYLESGDRILFLANTGLKPIRSTATLEAGSLEMWDTVTGKTAPAPFEVDSPGKVRMPVELAPAGSMLVVARKQAAAPSKPAAPARTPVQAAEWKASADSPNVLVIDYCDLQLGKESFTGINTWRANWLIWQHHGFERPAWDNAVQYKQDVFDRNHFPPGSGFRARFRFVVDDEAALPSLRLAVEVPDLYQISLNGKKLDFKQAQRWLDPHLMSLPVGAQAQKGENWVEIVADPFDVRMELENIYVLGDFYVEGAPRGWLVKQSRPMNLGSWAQAGYPFFSDSVSYRANVEIPAAGGSLEVALQKWNGSVAVLELDGKQAAVMGWPPYSASVPVSAGKHEIAIKVVSTPRNLFGPFHNPARLRMRAWPAAWAEFPDHPIPGAAYDVIDYGLMQPPLISLVK